MAIDMGMFKEWAESQDPVQIGTEENPEHVPYLQWASANASDAYKAFKEAMKSTGGSTDYAGSVTYHVTISGDNEVLLVNATDFGKGKSLRAEEIKFEHELMEEMNPGSIYQSFRLPKDSLDLLRVHGPEILDAQVEVKEKTS